MSNNEFFDELMTGLNEIKRIKKGELRPANVMTLKSRFKVENNNSPIIRGGGYIASIRYDLGLSQADFAKVLGVSTSTVSSWEQGMRKPSGTAAKLLILIDNDPSRINELSEFAQ